MKSLRIIADLHAHTLAATHAFDTYQDMAKGAKQAGMKAIAITDHGPAMPDSPHLWHFENLRVLPRALDGVVLLRGAEANVMDINGGLDFSAQHLAVFDWVVASIHSACLPGTLTESEATRLWLSIAQNPDVDCIGHSEQQAYRYDYDLVTRAFAANNKVVELNGNSAVVRPDGIDNMRKLVQACKANQCPIAIDSDAHSANQILPNIQSLLGIVAEEHFPEELIVNANVKNLIHTLRLHKSACAQEIGGILA